LDEVSEFALFRAIVETGGISAAALALQSSPAAVSRRLSALETKLGVRLAERSSRRFHLTDEGLLLYERCRSILDQIRDAEAEVASRGGAARGLLRIGAPADFGRKHIAPLLPAFTAQHPGLDAHLILSDIGLENQSDGCDLVFRFGLPSDPTMIARKIATTRQIVCAAPSYVARRGRPGSPDELRGHDCLRLARRHHLIDRWRFTKEDGEFEVHVSGNLSSGDGSVLRAWALSGEGISWEAYWDVADDLAAGRLLELLPEYGCSLMALYAVFAPSKPVPPRIRLFVDHMLQMMTQFTKDDLIITAPREVIALDENDR
jgi:LysR family transcriptional regulator, transcriptional activator for dmlA